MYDEAAVTQFVNKVHELATGPRVVEITHHFAGYFDELGVTIELDPRTKRGEVVQMKDRLFTWLRSAKFPFKWMISFEQAGKQRRVLFPDGMFT